MTTIFGLGAPAPPGRASATTPSTGFAIAEPPAPPATAGIVAAALPAGLLVLQADEAGEAQDRAARRHGRDLLAALAALQRAMLAGTADGESLGALARLLADRPAAADPRLCAVHGAILLRARVELARNDRAGAPATTAFEK